MYPNCSRNHWVIPVVDRVLNFMEVGYVYSPTIVPL